MPSTSPIARQHRPLEERRRALDLTLLGATPRRGWRLVTLTESEAQFVKGHPTSRLLQLILTFCTFGFWVPFWILVAIMTGEKHRTLVVDEFGAVVGGKRRATDRFAKGRTVARSSQSGGELASLRGRDEPGRGLPGRVLVEKPADQVRPAGVVVLDARK